MAEIMAAQRKALFGTVREISAVDYVDEVNKAGEGVWVILHLYKSGYPLSHNSFHCNLSHEVVAMATLAHPTMSHVRIDGVVFLIEQ